MKSAIEFGTSKIVCVIESNARKVVDLPGLACVRYEGIQNGHFVDHEGTQLSLQQAVETAEDRKKKQIKNAVVNVPGTFSRVILRSVKHKINGVVNSQHLKKMAKFACPEIEKGWTLVDIRPAYFYDDKDNLFVGMPYNIRTRFLMGYFTYYFAKDEYLDEVNRLLKPMRITVDRFIPESIAHALYYLQSSERDSSAVLIDVGYYDSNISMVYGDSVLSNITLHHGAFHLVNNLASQLRTDFQTAESLKRNHKFGIRNQKGAKVYGKNSSGKMEAFDARTVQSILDELLDDLLYEIVQALKTFKRFLSSKTVMYLCGSGLAIQDIAPHIQAKLGREIVDKTSVESHISPVFDSAFALLDNPKSSVYDLKDERVSKSIFDRFYKK